MGPRRLEMERLQTPTNRQRPTQPTSRRRQRQPSQRRLRPSHLPQRRLSQRHLEPLQLTQLVARKHQLQLQLRPPLRLRSLRLPHGPTQSRQKLPIQSPRQLQRRRHHLHQQPNQNHQTTKPQNPTHRRRSPNHRRLASAIHAAQPPRLSSGRH